MELVKRYDPEAFERNYRLGQENYARELRKAVIENIKNGTYPLSVDLCLISRKNDPNPNVQKMIDFMLSDTGQEIVEKTGYAGVR